MQAQEESEKAVILYSDRQINLIHEASKITVACLKAIVRKARAGMTTRDMDKIAAEEISRHGGVSAFLGYERHGLPPFPASICTSVNDVVIHGIPDDTPLKAGDVVSIDCGVKKDGYIGDTAYTIIIDESSAPFSEERRLIDVTSQSLWNGIGKVALGASIGGIAYAVQEHVESNGANVVRDFCGHGVGGSLHEEPNVPNYYTHGASYPKIRAGMVFTIEPMVYFGAPMIKADGWPVRTIGGNKSAHFEHTIAVDWGGKVRVLTDWEQPTP